MEHDQLWERAGGRATTVKAIALTSILSQRERKKTSEQAHKRKS
jgi:hypothetical protein